MAFPDRPTGRRQVVLLAAAALLPLAVVGVLVSSPRLDVAWQNQPAHFWIVLTAALVNLALAYVVTTAARRRRDARLFLVGLAFCASAGFLGLHALATPGVLLGKNAGFELAVPVGLAVAGVLAAASSVQLQEAGSARVMALARPLVIALAVLLVVWAVVSLAEAWPLDNPLPKEELDGWQLALAAVGVALYGIAAAGYFRLYRRRRARLLLGVTLAFALLADAMLVVAWATNWELSWWEWHVLMLLAVGLVAAGARAEWHEERFSALYLDETLAGSKEVSILFADLAGYTSFAERMAPDAVAVVLNTYYGSLVPLLERCGAEVHQLIGDAVMAIFNKQGDQPDHAYLAARSALAFQAEAARLADGHPEWPRFRSGVNSGEVVAAVVGAERGHRKHGVVGDTVNLAARLQAEAPVGAVLIADETLRRLPVGTVAERLPELHVKGKARPVTAHVLLSLPAVGD
jgi:class 3 adenylate cyclase